MIIKSKADSIQMQYTLQAMKAMAGRMGLTFAADANGQINYRAIRATMEMGYANYPTAPGVRFEDCDICPVHMEVSIPENLTSENIIYYIHGGGFCCGSARLSRGIASQLARDLGCKVFSVDYRLCPEHPFPANVDDCYTAYCALVNQFPNAQIAIVGESAGATLTLSVTLRALKDGTKKPACLFVNSPVANIANIDREKDGLDDCTISPSLFSVLENFYYTKETDLTSPDISPIFGDFTGCPTTIISACENETLSTDAYLLHDKLEQSNVDVTLLTVEGAFHAFGAAGRGTPESSQILDYAEEKIKNCFEKQ